MCGWIASDLITDNCARHVLHLYPCELLLTGKHETQAATTRGNRLMRMSVLRPPFSRFRVMLAGAGVLLEISSENTL